MLEIELKAPIEDADGLRRRLQAEGFAPVKKLREQDTYFKGVDRDFAVTDEALRLRVAENPDAGSIAVAITDKGPKMGANAKTRMEYEVGVSDGAAMRSLLLALGHTPVLDVVKTREYYTKNDMTACVDEVEGLGCFMELELLSPQEKDYAPAVEGLYQVLDVLGIPRGSCTRKSYLEMLLEKNAEKRL